MHRPIVQERNKNWEGIYKCNLKKIFLLYNVFFFHLGTYMYIVPKQQAH